MNANEWLIRWTVIGLCMTWYWTTPCTARRNRHKRLRTSDQDGTTEEDGDEFTTEMPKPWLSTDEEATNRNAKAETPVEMPEDEEAVSDGGPHARAAHGMNYVPINKVLMANCGQMHVKSMISNGQKVSEGDYPWIVSILYNGQPWCGGSLLNRQWVLTAAHCFVDDQNLEPVSISVGNVNWKKGKRFNLTKLVMHDRYNWDDMDNSDIALLKVAKKIPLSDTLSTVCLPTRLYENPKAKKLKVVGWGQTRYATPASVPETMQEVSLATYPLTGCSKKWKDDETTIYESQICLLGQKGRDACQGDSGSAAMERKGDTWYQVGIVTFGDDGCGTKMPAVYTRVSYFIDWIYSTIKKN